MTNTVSAQWAEEWQSARCLGDTDTFFLPDGKLKSIDKAKRVYAAKQMCKACPIRQKCLKYALDHDIQYGVWGGMSEHDRAELLKFRKDRPKPTDTQSLKARPTLASL